MFSTDAAPFPAMLCLCESSISDTMGMLCRFWCLQYGAVHSRGYLGQEHGIECHDREQTVFGVFHCGGCYITPDFFVAVPFGFTQKLFWRCPCCGHPFPYYVPTRGDNLKEKEYLRSIEGQHIKYAKLKFCPLIIPSLCPECKCKFFEMADDL